MRYVILRDDDTSALTPVACLERLYRPFLDRGLPVTLSVIPEVRRAAVRLDGGREGFVAAGPVTGSTTVALAENSALTDYLRANKDYHFAQHGCFHDPAEFDRLGAVEASRLLERGAQRLREAGLGEPCAFVAPHDRISRDSWPILARHFPVVSTGWFELERMPRRWRLPYLWKKIRWAAHWRAGGAALLSHPGCLLSCHRPPHMIVEAVRREIQKRRVTVLVTHWWEYFRDGVPDEAFIEALRETADYLDRTPGIRVMSFDDVASGRVPLT